MHQKLLNYFSRIQPLTEEEASAITETIVIRSYKKGDVLLREGQVSAEAYFVLDGCVRQYYLVDGEERTNNFFTAEQWVISMNSFGENTPADHYMVCSLDSVLVVGNREREEDLYRRFPRLEAISRRVMEKVFAEQQSLLAAYVTETPEQRYRRLLEQRPELVQLIPQYQLASYVGVKPESLSRIRKRIAQQ